MLSIFVMMSNVPEANLKLLILLLLLLTCWDYRCAPLLLARAVWGTEPRVSRYARPALYQLSYLSSPGTRIT